MIGGLLAPTGCAVQRPGSDDGLLCQIVHIIQKGVSNMITREVSIVINRPVGQVFAALADTKNQPQWDPGLLEARLAPDVPVRIGTKITEVRKFMGRTSENTGEVIEFEPNTRITRKSVDMPMTVVGTVTFTATPEGTKVSWRWDLQSKGLFTLVGPLIANSMNKNSESSLRGLKDLLERPIVPALS
jgi:uncharacterized membrane protein